jgi:hypothetical protein
MLFFIEKPTSRKASATKYVFKCSCGGLEFSRPNELLQQKLISFFEGYFKCNDCYKCHDYTSDAFVEKKLPKQIKLF